MSGRVSSSARVSSETYRGGTKRVVAPEVTFERLQQHLPVYGITRLADITALDYLGVPVYTAMRPRGRVTQFSQGKGARAIDAKVSALMEAIEGVHAENPTVEFVRGSMTSLLRAGRTPIDPTSLCDFIEESAFSPATNTLWVESRELISGRTCLVPASSVYFIAPNLIRTSSNGLASGNNELEASLHALLEVYERDALSGLVDEDGFSFDGCDVIDLSTIGSPILREHIDRIRLANVRLTLFRVAIDSPIHTFFAVFLDDAALASSSRVSCGFGSHLDPVIAASRAITEAAQTRLGMIHGAREFLTMDMFVDLHDQFFDLVSEREADATWSDLRDASTQTIDDDHAVVMSQFQREGASQIIRHSLTSPGDVVAVVKVQVPGARDEFPL